MLSLVIIRELRVQPAVPPNHGDDMVGLAYGLAVAFNIIMALGSLPSLLVRGKTVNKVWLNALLLLGLPLVFTIYATLAMEAFALWLCLPYLLVGTVLFIIRSRHKNHP
ncbi:hypothetical protein [Niabella hibiscisoli]|uniref:hypothetical protein n=1 Tax=Niabella hibiscisoli TaxID=1825928 RepID=UPI001F0D1752|nr:hypothetical protein [Niabella hibiscisoli]MCH5720383.1 hypothetical protein [Niabella hibiscisoli]